MAKTTAADPPAAIGTIPMPRISIRPYKDGGASANNRPPFVHNCVWSSERSLAPIPINLSATSDLPLPLSPNSSTAPSTGLPNGGQASPKITDVAWIRAVLESGEALFTAGSCVDARKRKLNDEARAGASALRIAFILGPNAPALTRDDLARDGETKSGVLSETVLGRPLGIEPLKNAFEIVFRNSWSFVLYHRSYGAAVDLSRNRDRAVVRAERDGIVDQVSEDLS